MADPTSMVKAHESYKVDRQRNVFVIKNAEALKLLGLAALNRSLGKVEFMDDADDLIPVGMVIGEKNGNNDNLTGDSGGTYSAVTRGGIILESVSVTGVSAITDIHKFVYATDGQTMTITKPATGVPIGIIVAWSATTYCSVYLFDFIESIMMGMANQPTSYKSFGTFPTNALQGTSGVTLHTETSKEHYKFTSLHALPKAHDNAAVAGSQAINLQIDSTDVTGGVLTLAYTSFDAAGDMGTIIDATAITAANEVHIGDTVILEMAASGTGFTADCAAAVEIFAVVENLPGA